jgi:hypothetical protein
MLGVYYEDDEGFEDDDNHKDNEMAIPSKSIKQGFQFRRKYMDVGVGQVKKKFHNQKKVTKPKKSVPKYNEIMHRPTHHLEEIVHFAPSFHHYLPSKSQGCIKQTSCKFQNMITLQSRIWGYQIFSGRTISKPVSG